MEKYNDSSDNALKTKLYVDLILNNIQYFGYYFAFCEDSFERLNNALWQTGRTCLLRGGITHSGTAYTGNIIKGIFTCFACNDFEVSESFVPNTLPLLRGTFYTENVINLFHSIYYKDDERLEEALSKAESFLTKKKLTGIAEYYVRFFCFLAKKMRKESPNVCKNFVKHIKGKAILFKKLISVLSRKYTVYIAW